MMNNKAPHPYPLEEFVAGELNEKENNMVTQHVAECEACLTYLDELWANLDLNWAETDIPELEPQTVYQLEQRLFRQIHRSSLGANTIWLGTKGIFEVFCAILKPFFQLKEKKSFS